MIQEVDIPLTEDLLTIKGENCLYKERYYGSFSRSTRIPVAVKHDKVDTIFVDVILTLTRPKAEDLKPKQINVKDKHVIKGGKKTKKQ